MMHLGLPDVLSKLVPAQYGKAKASAALAYASSELHILQTASGVPFQLRYCPTLAKKPVNNKEQEPKQKQKVDPFDNPSGDLVIGSIPQGDPTHVLVLNKFPIIPNHFILATRDFKEQTHDLEPSDLEATLACLRDWQGTSADEQLFAFFNSGTHSGASQPHRHIQFLPVQDMSQDDVAREWKLLMGSAASLKALPIATFHAHLPVSVSSAELHGIYTQLLASCRDAWLRYAAKSQIPPDEFSYNMGMTTSSMVLCPRTQEGVVLHRDDGSQVGFVVMNGTLLGGTLMVKRQEEWDYLRSTPGVIDRVLERVCPPQRHEKM